MQLLTTIKTTGEAGGMHHAFKALILAASQDASNHLSLALPAPPPVNGHYSVRFIIISVFAFFNSLRSILEAKAQLVCTSTGPAGGFHCKEKTAGPWPRGFL